MSGIRIFFASDIHGSETCFRKFLNAGQAYKADVLLLGGDLTGKLLIPIIHSANGYYEFTWLGKEYSLPENELTTYEKQMRMSGRYPYRTTPEEMGSLKENPAELKRTFRGQMRKSIQQWLELAEERLSKTGIECYIMPGNDDDLMIDETFRSVRWVKNPEGQVTIIKDNHEMIATGWTNPTPWKSPREMSEEQLEDKLGVMAVRLANPRRAIFNIHVPPYKSDLDSAPKMDANLKPVAGLGGVEFGPVGSISVRQAIERWQPLVALHGHVHESRGITRIGRTICMNPGSEYSEGILKGCLVLLDNDKVKDYMLTSG